MKIPLLSRRQLLTSSFMGAAGLLASKSAAAALGRACGLTPTQATGPFPPTPEQLAQQSDQDWDLTRVTGKAERAKGQVIEILGQVQNENCNPIPNATIEVWQACTSGKYNHPNDDSATWQDPNFQYFGWAKTDAKGCYRLKTVIPGHYSNDPLPKDDPEHWERTPHIHFRVWVAGHFELVTQMYFEPSTFDYDPTLTPEYIEKLNFLDRLLRPVPAGEKDRIVIPFLSGAARDGLIAKYGVPKSSVDPDAKAGEFTLVVTRAK